MSSPCSLHNTQCWFSSRCALRRKLFGHEIVFWSLTDGPFVTGVIGIMYNPHAHHPAFLRTASVKLATSSRFRFRWGSPKPSFVPYPAMQCSVRSCIERFHLVTCPIWGPQLVPGVVVKQCCKDDRDATSYKRPVCCAVCDHSLSYLKDQSDLNNTAIVGSRPCHMGISNWDGIAGWLPC